MNFTSRKYIVIPERIRDINEKHAQELADDIEINGLLQPLVLKSFDDPRLVIGGHRLRALEILAERGVQQYNFNGNMCHIDRVPYVKVGDLPPEHLLRMEIAENVVRLALDWQDKATAIARLHALEQQRAAEQPDPILHTARDTARKLQSLGDTRDATTINKEVLRAVTVAEHMDDPDVAAAKTLSEAWTVVRKKSIALSNRVLSKLMELAPTTSRHIFYKGEFQRFQSAISGVSLVLSDPPYGISADSWTSKFKNTPHQYDDSWYGARDIIWAILSDSYNFWTLPQANLFMFCSPELWHIVRDMAEEAGWTTWPRPLIWKKSNEGIRPWGTQGFCYTYESVLWATKGEKGLIKSIADVLEVYKVSNSEREHGAQKPVDLYIKLIETCCHPGDIIFDPTCGSGTIFPAAEATKTTAIGCEVNPDLFPQIEARISHLTPQLPAVQGDIEAFLGEL
jgi:hypothetical protein